MKTTHVSQIYLKNQIETATPLERVVLAYEGAITFLNLAKNLMEAKKFTDATIANIRAQNIITELKMSLNMEAGEISHRLSNLYSYFIKKLISANLERNVNHIEEVLKHMMDLKKSWEEISKQKIGGQENVSNKE
ncbi:MAG: flagellar export chaperone FliS [Elusimicrobiales bacterium]|nr:flagellar export chaperone FliS [Elusimicrobiales bacterium]